ncbi:ABC-2 transporter permease [Lachnotalea glycerini]|jgi:hypothetical protein|uniref:ABC-2 transporter permease n=1 Tax=Lachnotalea glycerini TaxID=1763509 RepID=A0A371JE83_9FIRM|nr:ABC-2 transporter permease [Lachnotalea glycerini]RDY31071.1 ABC-2 transporter permease [Lachnotalea glycerini]
MNFNLIKKEFLLMKRKLFIYMILCLGLIVFAKLFVNQEIIENILVGAIGALFSYFITIILFEAEEKDKAEAIMVTLPYTRREIVKAKYNYLIFVSVLFYCLCMLESGFLVLFQIGTFCTSGILYGLFASIVIYGLMIPFFIRFHYVKATNVMMLSIMGINAFVVLYSKNFVALISPINSLKQIDLIKAGIFSVSVIVISYMLSKFFYQNKELL